jgi:hypothetical protein
VPLRARARAWSARSRNSARRRNLARNRVPKRNRNRVRSHGPNARRPPHVRPARRGIAAIAVEKRNAAADGTDS